MPLLVLPSRTLLRLAAICGLVTLAPEARAQTSLSHADDAAPVPRGVLRVNVTTGWGRFDERFTSSGKRTLGDEASADSLGPRQFPALTPVEAGLQVLSNDPRMRLSLGRLATISDVRTVTTPITFEYGLTRRLSVGVLVPLVQTRRSISLAVNRDSSGNVGYVANRFRSTAASTNLAVYTSMKSAADSIGVLLSRCPSNPGAVGCAAVIGNPSDAAAAKAQAQKFADAVKSALGLDTSTTIVAPRNGSTLAASIDAQRSTINAQLQKYLGAGSGAVSGVFTASAPLTYVDLQGAGKVGGFLQSPLGGLLDSLYTKTDRLRVNGASVGAQFLAYDSFARDTLPPTGIQTRLMVGGSYRFATPFIDTTSAVAVLNDNGAGIEGHSTMDVIRGHWAATIGARFTKSFAATVFAPLLGDPESILPVPVYGTAQRTAGSVFGLDVTPRYLVGEWFALDALYGLERTGATTYAFAAPTTVCAGCESFTFTPGTATRTAQRVGFGFRYSTVESTARGRTAFPVEVTFSHLQTISGDPGVPNLTREQLQVRLFLRLRD